MRHKIKTKKILRTFNILKGDWLLDKNNEILVIVDYKTETVEPEVNEIPVKKNTSIFRSRTKPKPEPTTYVTKLHIIGYNASGKFVGSYNEDFCCDFIRYVENGTVNPMEYRKRWLDILEQKDAMLEAEERLKKEEKKDVVGSFKEGDCAAYNWLDDDGNDSWKVGLIVKVDDHLMYHNDDGTERCGYIPLSDGVKLLSNL